jgi:hypothetical protein
MRSFRYIYLLGGIGFLGFAIIFSFKVIDFDIISDFIKNGVTEKTEDKLGQVFMLLFDLANFWLLIFVLIFAVVGIYLLIKFVRNSISDIRNHKIEQFGVNGTGTYLKNKEVVAVNDVPYYEIHFSYKNDYREVVETKTSGGVFRMCEVEALAIMKTFPIKYLDNKATIVADKQVLLEIFYKSCVNKHSAK